MDSGKYLNVHYGVDANGTNVYQWSYDGSTEQKFKVVYSSSTDSYKIYAMCSSNGTNRVIDIARNGSPLASGQNVEIWTPVDNIAQQLQIEYLNHNYYVMRMKANTSMFIAVNGTANGTGSGTSSTSAGNVYIDTYDVYRSQEWAFELISQPTTVNPTGELEAVSEIGVSGWAWRSDIPNTSITVYIYITNNYTGAEYVYTTPANRYRSDLASSYANHGFYLALDWDDFPVGTYTVNAYGESTTGSLVLLSGGPRTYTVGGPINMGALTLNTSRSATLTAGSEHIYTFTPSVAGTYVVQTSGSTDTYGTITVTQNNTPQTWYNDDDGEGNNFYSLVYAPANNTVQIKVRHFNSTSGTGTYSIKVHRARAQIYTFDYGFVNISTHIDGEFPNSAFTHLGYETHWNKDVSSTHPITVNSDGLTNFNSEVIFFSSHGSQDSTGQYESGLDFIDDSFETDEFPKNMYNVKLAVWSACKSANPNLINAKNVAETAYINGADVSIGWKERISNATAVTWNLAFFSYVYSGTTISQAINYANSVIGNSDLTFCSAIQTYGDLGLYLQPISFVDSTPLPLQMVGEFIDSNQMEIQMSGYDYSVAQLPFGTTRYTKMINGLPSNDYIDIWADGTIYRSKEVITQKDINTLKKTSSKKEVSTTENLLSTNNENYKYYRIIDGKLTLIEVEENIIPEGIERTYMDIESTSIIPYEKIY